MIAPASKPRLPGTILDASGSPVRRAQFNAAGYGSDYIASQNDRFRKLYGGMESRVEDDMLNQRQRVAIISYLRRSIRNNPVMAALARTYAETIGSPIIHSTSDDEAYNDARESFLDTTFDRIMQPQGYDLQAFMRILCVEELIAGEWFLIEQPDGTVQFIPSELCGSPDAGKRKNEFLGIVYDNNGYITHYRFGVRIRYNNGMPSKISYAEQDGAKFYPASRVIHGGEPMRVEEGRYSPKLSAAIPAIQDLDDIVNAKVQQIKNQSAFAMVFKKNYDPALFAEMLSAASRDSDLQGSLIEQAASRNNYQDIQVGTIYHAEVGEDLQMVQPSFQSADFDDFQFGRLQAICATISFPAEEVVMGYRRSSYSSARADKLRLSRTVANAQKRAKSLLYRLSKTATEWGVVQNILPERPQDIYKLRFDFPQVREIDEQRHANTLVSLYNNGLITKGKITAEQGELGSDVDDELINEAIERVKKLKERAETEGLDFNLVASMIAGAKNIQPAQLDPTVDNDI
jgi:hypothetical protein